jgi:hypothetical protein
MIVPRLLKIAYESTVMFLRRKFTEWR